MFGPGKYDRLCTLVRDRARARGAVLIVFDGEHGHGFSAQLPVEAYGAIVLALRSVADEIERDMTAAGPGTPS